MGETLPTTSSFSEDHLCNPAGPVAPGCRGGRALCTLHPHPEPLPWWTMLEECQGHPQKRPSHDPHTLHRHILTASGPSRRAALTGPGLHLHAEPLLTPPGPRPPPDTARQGNSDMHLQGPAPFQGNRQAAPLSSALLSPGRPPSTCVCQSPRSPSHPRGPEGKSARPIHRLLC